MKTLKEFYDLLNAEANFHKKYPQYNKNDHKIHVLFLSPLLNEAGYYRMLLPAMELNKTDSHSAIVSSIQKWNFNKQFDDYDNPIDLRLIEWADYVVFPAMFTDINYIIKNMREINENIEFVMDIDLNYHELPAHHPGNNKITAEAKKMLMQNLKKTDLLTAPNSQLLNYYYQLTEETQDEYALYFETYQNLLSEFTFEEIQIKRNQTEKVNIGIILFSDQAEDIRSIENALRHIMQNNPDKIELILIGWSQKLAEQNKVLKDIPVKFQKPVIFTEYQNMLNEQILDIGLLPLVDNTFNTSGKAITHFLDYSALMIPVIASDVLPFKNIIAEGETGMIAGSEAEWISKTEQLINDPELRNEIGTNANKMAWQKFSYNEKTIRRLKNVFA